MPSLAGLPQWPRDSEALVDSESNDAVSLGGVGV
jgi:hypothetical protein